MKRLFVLALLVLSTATLIAKEKEEGKDKGRLSGSFETNSIFYHQDSKTGNDAKSGAF